MADNEGIIVEQFALELYNGHEGLARAFMRGMRMVMHGVRCLDKAPAGYLDGYLELGLRMLMWEASTTDQDPALIDEAEHTLNAQLVKKLADASLPPALSEEALLKLLQAIIRGEEPN